MTLRLRRVCRTLITSISEERALYVSPKPGTSTPFLLCSAPISSPATQSDSPSLDIAPTRKTPDASSSSSPPIYVQWQRRNRHAAPKHELQRTQPGAPPHHTAVSKPPLYALPPPPPAPDEPLKCASSPITPKLRGK